MVRNYNAVILPLAARAALLAGLAYVMIAHMIYIVFERRKVTFSIKDSDSDAIDETRWILSAFWPLTFVGFTVWQIARTISFVLKVIFIRIPRAVVLGIECWFRALFMKGSAMPDKGPYRTGSATMREIRRARGYDTGPR